MLLLTQSKRFQCFAIWGMSLFFRIFFGLARPISDDVYRLYSQALDWYVDGKLSPVGAPVVYTGTWIPGSLHPILLGSSLWISQGYLWGATLVLAVLTQAALFLIYHSYSSRFPNWPKVPLAILIAYNPWTFPSLEVWNPSYALLFSTLFFAAWIHPKFKIHRDFWVGFTLLCSFQLHLSYVVLVASAFFAYFIFKSRPQLLKLLAGAGVGSLTLIPWIIEFIKGTVSSPFQNNIVFRPDGWPEIFKGLGRFLSYPSADLFRFIGGAQGYLGAFRDSTAYWWPFLLVAMVVSIALIFYQIRGWLLSLKAKDTELKPFFQWLILVPLFTMFLFIFSVKGASAHTFWIILPWAFFPIGFMLSQKPGLSKLTAHNVIFGLILMVRVLQVSSGPWFIQYELQHSSKTQSSSLNIPERELRLYDRLGQPSLTR